MDKWIKLETRLRKKITIDKEIQEQEKVEIVEQENNNHMQI